MDENYIINEELVYFTLGVPKEAMSIYGWDEIDIQELKDKDGILGKNLARKIDVSPKSIADWTNLHKQGKYNDKIHCPPTYKKCSERGIELVSGFCKTKGADGAGKKTIRAVEVDFHDYNGTSAKDWETIARSNENRPLEEREDFIKNDRTDADIVDSMMQTEIKLSERKNDKHVKTEKFLNKRLTEFKVPKSRWLIVKNLYRDELGIDTDRNVRTITPSTADEEKFQEEVKNLFPDKKILFATMGQSGHSKLATDCIRKILDNGPYDMVIMKHTRCTNIEGLRTARKRDRNFFTNEESLFCQDLKRFKSPLEGPWPDVKFEPQTDKEIAEWKQRGILV